MRGIRFSLTFREVRRLAHQSDFAISRLMEIVFRNMAYRSVICELSSHREKWLRSFPGVVGTVLSQCVCLVPKGEVR